VLIGICAYSRPSMLENTRLSISEIGLRTGYNNPAALSRAFKARFGRAPRQLRQ